ncbi:FHA domain-containing protein [Megalodesulfovibrio paquesii]
MGENSGNTAPHAAGPQLVLRFEGQELVLGQGQGAMPTASLGRDKTNDLVAAQKFVSRQHAVVECVRDRFVFTDMSANGTYVLPQGQELLHVHGAKMFLEGAGLLSLGLHPDRPEALHVEYVVL